MANKAPGGVTMGQIIAASQQGSNSAMVAAESIQKKTRSAAQAILDLTEEKINTQPPQLGGAAQQKFKDEITADLSWAESFFSSTIKVLQAAGSDKGQQK